MNTSPWFTSLAGVLVLAIVAVAGISSHRNVVPASAPNRQHGAHAVPPPQRTAGHDRSVRGTDSTPISDRAMKEAIPQSYPRPTSEWQSVEKSIYKKLLSSGRFDVLVVPFQVREYALDRPTRSLMTAGLAMKIAAAKKASVADPYLVARALGEGNRTLDPGDVYALADGIGARQIIWGYVGHDRKGRMSVSIRSQTRDQNGLLTADTEASTRTFDPIPFSDERPPVEAYQAMLPEILAAVGADGTASGVEVPEDPTDSRELPEEPMALFTGQHGGATDALIFQVLAALTPYAAERTRERFAEKSYLAARNIPATAADARLLKARALMLLGLRPAALHMLAEPRSVGEKELVALLNGNQPDVDRYSSEMQPGMYRLITTLDANFLASRYASIGKQESWALAESLHLPGTKWPFLSARAFADHDFWAQFDNAHLRQLLDHEFPIKDDTIEGIIRGATSLGDPDRLQTLIDLSVINHVRKLLEIEAAKWCCGPSADQPSPIDYLHFIEAIGDDNLMRRAEFLTRTQGNPERSLEFLNRIENLYRDHPQHSLARAAAQVSVAENLEQGEKEALQKSAYANAFNAWYWEQGQTILAADAFDSFSEIGRRDYGIFDNVYASDHPYRPFYPDWEHGGLPEFALANAEAALRHATWNTRALQTLNWFFTDFRKQDDKLDALMKSIDGRFIGNPYVYQLRAENSQARGDLPSAERYLRESIKVQPKAWWAYDDLGLLLVEQGRLQEAAAQFMEYPGFDEHSGENPVGISNHAYDAGSRFYWLGEFSLATPLYEIAVRIPTNSEADITSQLRMDLLAGNYHGAMLGSLERARHYNDTYAFRDYLGLLHAMGKSDVAWDTFNVLSRQIDNPHIWETVLVGHRKENRSEADIVAWVRQQIDHNIGRTSNRAAKYLLRTGIMDRTPGAEWLQVLTEVVQPAWKLGNSFGHVVESSSDGQRQFILGPRTTDNGTLPIGVFDASEKSRAKSNLVYFAEAYLAIRAEDYLSAKALFEEAAALYDLSHNNLGYILPYYAYAAAKTGDGAGVDKYLQGLGPELRGFDYLLARGVLSGIGGNTEESLGLLKSALYKRPFTEDRPLPTEYQYAEICRLLYEATGKPQYRQLALDWARKNQRFQPWHAWAYALDAALSDDGPDRRRAIAMAAYLDPGSELLAKIPSSVVESAVKEYAGTNLFLEETPAEEQEPI